MAPALLALRAETAHWQLSPREARIALLTGVPGATTLAEAALRNPAALLARMAEGVARQVLYDATALGPLCAIPFLLGVGAARETREPLAVAAWFTALPLARRSGARLWLTRPAWIRPPWTPPADAYAVARPCGGTFVLFEVGG